MEQGGRIANTTGNMLEGFIEDILKRKKYTFVNKKDFIPASKFNEPIYTRQFEICKSIYNTTLYCDFILFHPEKHPSFLAIESKWQQSKGSVDEKYPYTIINIKERYPYKTILILDGGGYKAGAEKWLRNQVGDNLLNVFNMSEFQIWVNKNGL